MKSRFYPAEWPEVKTEATPDKFEIVHSTPSEKVY